MALAYNSPARNWANSAACETTDQRGIPRSWYPLCDIGAYEFSPILIVDSLNDPGDGTCDITECTLRDEVANSVPGGSITFDSSLGGNVITLGSEIGIPKNLTINGTSLSSHVQVSGGDSVRVFNVNSGVTALIIHIDVAHGSEVVGGGIYNDGILTISNSNLIYNNGTNAGGAIYNHGTLTVITSTLLSNSAGLYGGGIYNYETLSVSSSTLSGNETYSGGGIYTTGGTTTTVTTSTFYGNIASHASYPSDNGGGIYSSGLMTMTNNTLSNNSADSAGGGLYKTSGSTLHIVNNIIANSPIGGDCVSSGGTFATNSNNLIQDGSCSPALTGNPQLGPMTTNNGGTTQTMALLVGSPAIDAGDNDFCGPIDQRGITRPQGDHCDIGAYEFEYLKIFIPLVLR
jgi:hypothetical protein